MYMTLFLNQSNLIHVMHKLLHAVVWARVLEVKRVAHSPASVERMRRKDLGLIRRQTQR